jgi:hypothetical protein
MSTKMKKETATRIAFFILGLFVCVLFPASAASQALDSFFVAGTHPAASLQPHRKLLTLLSVFLNPVLF